MLRTYTARYGLIALLISSTFVTAYTALEMAEQLYPLTLFQFMAANSVEYLLVLSMALTLIALGCWTGWQRDRITAVVREREALNRILRTLMVASDRDLDRALPALLRDVATAVDAREAALLLREEQQWTVRAATGPLPDTLMPLVQNTVWPPITQEPVMLPWEPPVTGTDKPAYRAALLQAVSTEAGPLGWLLLLTRTAQPPRRSVAEWLLTVANQIGVALMHARQSALIRRRARDLEALTQINRTLLAGMDLDQLLNAIVISAQVRFGLPFVTVMWIDHSAGEFYLRAQAGPLTANVIPHFRQKITEGLASRVLRTGQPYLARDTRAEPAYIPPVKADIRSLLLAPLKVANHVIGVMTFESLDWDAFSAEDVAALTALADQAAIAAENTRLLATAQRERQRLAAILHSARDVVLLIDNANVVQLINPAAEKLIGAAATVCGQPIDQLPPLGFIANAIEERSFEVTLPNDLTYLVTVNTARDEAGTLFGRVVVMHDVTYLKQLDQLKTQMIQLASHDLRAPLSIAFGYLDVLLEDVPALNPYHGQALRGLETALNRMQTLVTELLDLDRIESGLDQLVESIDVVTLITALVQEFAETAQLHQQQLTLQTAEAVPVIYGDPLRLRQALGNLINNALKYTPHGGSITVRVGQVDRHVVIEVQDTGYGIPAAAQAKLFQRFYRAKTPGTEDITGTGLGLSLVKAVIDQHSGTIKVASEVGQGSTFQVWLPLTMTNNRPPITNN